MTLPSSVPILRAVKVPLPKIKSKKRFTEAPKWTEINYVGAISALHRKFHGVTKDPIWVLVNSLLRPKRRLELSQALSKAGVTSAEYLSWKHVALSSDILDAISRIGKHYEGYRLPQLSSILPQNLHSSDAHMFQDAPPGRNVVLPTWLTLHIVSHKIRTLACAQVVAPFTMSQLPNTPSSLTQPLLVLAVQSLSAWSLQTPIGNILHAFIHAPIVAQKEYNVNFNGLLQSLANFPHNTPLIAKYIVHVLKTMRERQIALNPRTHSSLLASDSLTLELTKMLRERMISEGRRPTQEQLESFLRFFAQSGYADSAGRYLMALRSSLAGTAAPLPRDTSLPRDEDEGDVTGHNLLYLKALSNDPTTAFGYLKSLTLDPDAASDVLSRRLRSISDNHRKGRRPLPSGHAYEEVMALNILAKHQNAEAEQLLMAFHNSQKQGSAFRIHQRAKYTVIIRALTHRHNYRRAYALFLQFLSEGAGSLDAPLLRAGISAQALAGDPAGAFRTMFKYTRAADIPNSGHAVRNTGKIRRDIKFFNAFLYTLHQLKRPDLVFMMWDSMDNAFGVAPDGLTMSFMLNTARKASLGQRGSFGLIQSIWGTFRDKQSQWGILPSRTAKQKLIKALSTEPTRFTNFSLWDDVPAWRRAREVFRTMLFAAFPQLNQSSSGESDSWSLISNIRGKLRSRSGLSHEGQLLPFPVSQQAFAAYIHLLAAAALGQEIPEALNWMYRLGLTFTCDILAMAVVGWEEHNSSSRGVMGMAGSGEALVRRLQSLGAETDNRWPTNKDLWRAREQLYIEQRRSYGED